MWHGGSILSASFNVEDTSVVTASDDTGSRAPESASASPPAASAKSGNHFGASRPMGDAKFFQLKVQLADAPGDDFWGKVGRWFFADRNTRTISPQSTVTIQEYRAREAAALKAPLLKAGP